MTHPLTDQMCESICQNCDTFASQNEIWFQSMRSSYDLATEHVIEWLQANLGMYEGDDLGYTYIKEDFLSDKVIDEDKLINDLKKAMRPQENN